METMARAKPKKKAAKIVAIEAGKEPYPLRLEPSVVLNLEDEGAELNRRPANLIDTIFKAYFSLPKNERNQFLNNVSKYTGRRLK